MWWQDNSQLYELIRTPLLHNWPVLNRLWDGEGCKGYTSCVFQILKKEGCICQLHMEIPLTWDIPCHPDNVLEIQSSEDSTPVWATVGTHKHIHNTLSKWVNLGSGAGPRLNHTSNHIHMSSLLTVYLVNPSCLVCLKFLLDSAYHLKRMIASPQDKHWNSKVNSLWILNCKSTHLIQTTICMKISLKLGILKPWYSSLLNFHKWSPTSETGQSLAYNDFSKGKAFLSTTAIIKQHCFTSVSLHQHSVRRLNKITMHGYPFILTLPLI